jgi:ribonucleoside-diphosphate reductase alpha chain
MTEKRRGKVLKGDTRLMVTGCGDLFITINDKNNEPYEIFLTMGKSGVCALAQCSAIARISSLGLQAGVTVRKLTKHLSGISCQSPSNADNERVLSCADAVAQALKLHNDELAKEVAK